MHRFSRRQCVSLGWVVLVASLLYFISDVIEAANGGFSDFQLWLTFLAEAAIPFFVVGLALVQRPRIGGIGVAGAAIYAWAFIFFAFTVLYAIFDSTPDFDTLNDELSPWMTIHGVVMVVGAVLFAWGSFKAGLFPTAAVLLFALGVVANAGTAGASDAVQLPVVAVRDLGFALMGLTLIRAPERFARPELPA